MKKTIYAFTGIRSDYDLMYPVYKVLDSHKNINFKIIVTGAHLSHEKGLTVKDIVRDGFRINHKITSLLSSDSFQGRLKGLAIQILTLSDIFSNKKPDLLIVLGDREESMSIALVSAYLNIPLAHFGGGDRVIGNVDDQIRHAVSKLAHIHFTFSKEASERLKLMGEQSKRIFFVGNPGIERLKNVKKIERSSLLKLFSLKPKSKFCILLQHVISSEKDDSKFQMQQTLMALDEMNIQTIIIRPNTDPGSFQINVLIDQWIKKNKNFKAFHNLDREKFCNLLKNAEFLIGNSSLGILEAPSIKLPVINIGNRQRGRLHSENVIFCTHKKISIKNAISTLRNDKSFKSKLKVCTQYYGNGNTSKKLLKILFRIFEYKDLLIKDITY